MGGSLCQRSTSALEGGRFILVFARTRFWENPKGNVTGKMVTRQVPGLLLESPQPISEKLFQARLGLQTARTA